MAEHPDYDEWWRARDTRRACYNIRPAMLVVGGTFDAEDCYGAGTFTKPSCARAPGLRSIWSSAVGHGAWRGDRA